MSLFVICENANQCKRAGISWLNKRDYDYYMSIAGSLGYMIVYIPRINCFNWARLLCYTQSHIDIRRSQCPDIETVCIREYERRVREHG